MTALSAMLIEALNARKGKGGEDLAELTKLAKDVIVQQIERYLQNTVDSEKEDYAVLCGVQVHGPGGHNYWAPDYDHSYVVVKGVKTILDIPRPEAVVRPSRRTKQAPPEAEKDTDRARKTPSK